MNAAPAQLLRWYAPWALAVALPLSSTRAEPKISDARLQQATVAKLQTAIGGALPKGWSVSYEKETRWLEIKRTEPLLVLEATPTRPLLNWKPMRAD